MSNQNHPLHFRPLGDAEEPPYELLLLADPELAAIHKYLGQSEIVLAFNAEKLVGVYVLLAYNKVAAEIKNIAVAEPWQGRGIGRQLLEHAIQAARDNGFRDIYIGTANTSFGQLALYQKLGFRLFDIRKNYFVNNYASPLFENGLAVTDMLMLQLKLVEDATNSIRFSLNQITLPVKSVEKSLAFYSRFGLQPLVISLPHYARLLSSDGQTTLSLEANDSANGATGAHLYFESDDLDEMVENLQKKGFEFDSAPTDQNWLWREARLTDPDGHQLICYRAGDMRLNPPWRVSG